MKVEKYNLKTSSKVKRYEFISEGPKGAIRKLIEFQETYDAGLFNLAFDDANALTGEINDLSVSDHGDTEKVLATVVVVVYAFSRSIPTLMCIHRVAQQQEQGFTEWALPNTSTRCNRTFIFTDKWAMT